MTTSVTQLQYKLSIHIKNWNTKKWINIKQIKHHTANTLVNLSLNLIEV